MTGLVPEGFYTFDLYVKNTAVNNDESRLEFMSAAIEVRCKKTDSVLHDDNDRIVWDLTAADATRSTFTNISENSSEFVAGVEGFLTEDGLTAHRECTP